MAEGVCPYIWAIATYTLLLTSVDGILYALGVVATRPRCYRSFPSQTTPPLAVGENRLSAVLSLVRRSTAQAVRVSQTLSRGSGSLCCISSGSGSYVKHRWSALKGGQSGVGSEIPSDRPWTVRICTGLSALFGLIAHAGCLDRAADRESDRDVTPRSDSQGSFAMAAPGCRGSSNRGWSRANSPASSSTFKGFPAPCSRPPLARPRRAASSLPSQLYLWLRQTRATDNLPPVP
jgi:hypothetical protein